MCNILLIDDDEEFIVSMIEFLKEFNNKDYEYFYETSPSNALKEITKNIYDIYIIDYELDDEINGSTLIEKIREKNKLIPIIIFSANITLEKAIDMLGSGVDEYIRKKDYKKLPYSINNQLSKYIKLNYVLNTNEIINKLLIKFSQILNWVLKHDFEEVSFEKILYNFLKILDLSRVYLYEKFDENFILTHEYTKSGYKNRKSYYQIIYNCDCFIINKIKNNEYVYGISEDFKKNHLICNMVDTLNIKSFVMIPIQGENKNSVVGFVGFDDCAKKRLWSENELVSLQVIGSLLGTIYSKRKSEKKLHKIINSSVEQLQIHSTQLTNILEQSEKKIESLHLRVSPAL